VVIFAACVVVVVIRCEVRDGGPAPTYCRDRCAAQPNSPCGCQPEQATG